MATIDLGLVVGKDGLGVPAGGSAGQVLSKASSKDNDTKWIDLPQGGSGGAEIDDTTPSAEKVYSSQKTLYELNQLSQQKADKDGVLRSDPQEDESTEAPEMGSVPINADQLGGMTYQMIVDLIYPIGRTITTLDDADNPNTLYPWQVWERTAKGRMVIGTGAPEDNDDGSSPGSYNMALGSKGGEEKHKLTKDELPNITGGIYLRGSNNTYSSIIGTPSGVFSSETEENQSSTFKLEGAGIFTKINMSFGNDQPHNNMSPWLAANIWKRVS